MAINRLRVNGQGAWVLPAQSRGSGGAVWSPGFENIWFHMLINPHLGTCDDLQKLRCKFFNSNAQTHLSPNVVFGKIIFDILLLVVERPGGFLSKYIDKVF